MKNVEELGKIHFSADELNLLHIKAEDLWRIPANQGWQKSPVSPMEILKLFDGIWIKKGYVLRGYIYREKMNGVGVVWALPESEFPEVEECERFDVLRAPKPRNALNVIDVLEGDGSPRSYIHTSIFYREMLEFGALWHGLSWGLHDIIEEKPEFFDVVDLDLKPRVIFGKFGKGIRVEFFTLCGLFRWRVFKHTDTFTDYKIKPHVTVVAEGGKGYTP